MASIDIDATSNCPEQINIMSDQTIAELYASNDRIREKFKGTITGLSESQLSTLPDGEKWTVAQIVEHVSIVENGIARICSKLLSNAKDNGQLSDGTVKGGHWFEAHVSIIAEVFVTEEEGAPEPPK